MDFGSIYKYIYTQLLEIFLVKLVIIFCLMTTREHFFRIYYCRIYYCEQAAVLKVFQRGLNRGAAIVLNVPIARFNDNILILAGGDIHFHMN